MQIAIISDIHDNIWSLETVLQEVGGSDALVCCGDFCAPFTLKQIAEGFSGAIHAVFGNNDGDQFLLAKIAAPFEHVTLHGDFASVELGGRQVAVNHYPPIGHALLLSGQFDLVCYGHSHEASVTRHGDSVAVNPGEVMGRFGRVTFGLYDTGTGKAVIKEVQD